MHRRWHHDDITFGLVYAFSENFVLPLSHDEVVHGKGSLVNKMSGLEGEKFATLRAYYGAMWGYPGKKLLFMGQDFAQRREWNENVGLDWDLLQYGPHRGVNDLVRDLNHRLSRQAGAASSATARATASNGSSSTTPPMRSSPGPATQTGANPVAVVLNMTPVAREAYALPLPQGRPMARDPQHRRRALWRRQSRQSRRRHGAGGRMGRQAGACQAHAAAVVGAVPGMGGSMIAAVDGRGMTPSIRR